MDRTDTAVNEAGDLVSKMWATPARSNVGRAAKVRVFLRHEAKPEFKQVGKETDQDIRLCRQLLLQLAGMTIADLHELAI